MGIFNLFNKEPAISRTDLIWINYAAKLNGTRDYLSKNKTDLCVAWFEETHRGFTRFLNEENHMNIGISMAGSLRLYDLGGKNAVFLEHYPLYKKEADLLSNYKPASVCFMNSLDDALFQIFGGNIAALMRGMGLGEEEYIENSMVTSSVIKAQKKVEKKIREDFYVRSGQEWIDRYRSYYQHHQR